MITVGYRVERLIARQGDGILLAEGARFSETIAHLAKSTFIPKGVYRFQSHTGSNKQQADCLAKGMGRLSRRASVMEEYSRPATLEDLKTLLRSLKQHHVDYFLIRRLWAGGAWLSTGNDRY